MKHLSFNRVMIVICTAVILTGFPITGFSISDSPVGKVVALRGNVTALQPDYKSRNLSLKSPVFLGDTIKTTQGRLQLMFNDNTLITLGRNTEMIIEEYQWKPKSFDSIMKTRIKAGSFRVMGGAITRDAPQNFKTHAPSATIGIRGSIYAGIVKGKSLSVVFQGGKGIYVVNERGRVDIDRPGYGTIVSDAGKAPEKPKKFNKKTLKEIEGDLTASDKKKEEKTAATGNRTTPGEKQEETTISIPDRIDESITDKTDEIRELKTKADEEEPSEIDPDDPMTEEEKTILSLLEKQGFSGESTLSIPSSGLWQYKGELRNNTEEIIDGFVTIYVNWDNQRFFAVDGKTNDPYMASFGFAFGEIMDTGEITNVHVLGSGSSADMEKIMAMTGSEIFGHFYGASQEAAGIVMEGFDINVQDQTERLPWSDTLAVLVDGKINNPNSGTADWNGFYTGIGEDMNAPNTDRVLFINADSDEFKLTIDKDSGTVFGTLSGKDFLGTETQITSLTLGGGTSESVYVSDNRMTALLGGTNVILNSSGSIDLKAAGNFMVSSMDTPLSENTNWGYWEIAYEEPGTGKDYHVHVPGSLWIAGEQTSESTMNTLIATSFLATYTGRAQGVKFDDTSQMMQLTNGQTELTIEFDSEASRPVYGTISFDEATLPITSSMGDVTAMGFKGEISSAATSRINGTYFGSNAQGIGGNFSAIMPDGINYQGIFAGDR